MSALAPATAKPLPRPLARELGDLGRGLAFLAPNFVGFLLFTLVPVVAIFVVAFTTGSYASGVDPVSGSFWIDARFCGLDHFRTMLGDGAFWQSLGNTFVFLLAVPFSMAASLGLALLLNQKIPGRVVYRTLLFLPTIAAGLALYMIWRQIYNQEFGLFNQILSAIGLFEAGQGPDWLGNESLAKPALLAMLVWVGMGGTNMILYLAALQDVDVTLYEAASLDGAGEWSCFRYITWPALRPTTFFVLTTNLIGGIQIFDQILIMTGGGPQGSTSTILYYLYQNIYEFDRLGYAAALSVVLFGIVLTMTLVNWRLNRSAREA
ncbi:MAG: sugar ABC transporter permease [Planctomycetes bacterium]|nr:sugar ABC transporter permease [Planctomycetota bacterium]